MLDRPLLLQWQEAPITSSEHRTQVVVLIAFDDAVVEERLLVVALLEQAGSAGAGLAFA